MQGDRRYGRLLHEYVFVTLPIKRIPTRDVNMDKQGRRTRPTAVTRLISIIDPPARPVTKSSLACFKSSYPSIVDKENDTDVKKF